MKSVNPNKLRRMKLEMTQPGTFDIPCGVAMQRAVGYSVATPSFRKPRSGYPKSRDSGFVLRTPRNDDDPIFKDQLDPWEREASSSATSGCRERQRCCIIFAADGSAPFWL